MTLNRREDKAFVASWLSEPAAEPSRLDPPGEGALQESAVTAKRVWDRIADVCGEEWGK